jgi:hypothetical protein
MIGTAQQRAEMAAILEKTRGQAWALGSEEWREMEISGAVRQKEMEQHLQARSFVPQPIVQPANATPVDVIEDTGDPREGLREARAALAEAEQARDDAGETVDRALRRMAKAESDLAQFDSLNGKIDAWHIAQVRTGGTGEMPYALASASRERAAATDRLEHAHRAHQALTGELKDAESKVQQCQRAASLRAQRVLLEQAEERAEALERLMATADDIRAELDALAQCSFPNAGGVCQVTPPILRALNMVSKPRDELTPLDLQPFKERWQEQHARLLNE